MFLLDTDHVGIIQRQTEPEYGRLLGRMRHHPPAAFSVSIVSFHEQVMGWNAYVQKAQDSTGVSRAYRMFGRILADFSTAQVVPFDQAAVNAFDALRQQKVRVGVMDLRIAAISMSRGFIVLTRNLVDFRRVPGLVVEDWTA